MDCTSPKCLYSTRAYSRVRLAQESLVQPHRALPARRWHLLLAPPRQIPITMDLASPTVIRMQYFTARVEIPLTSIILQLLVSGLQVALLQRNAHDLQEHGARLCRQGDHALCARVG